MFVTTMRTARILGWGREPRTTEFAPPPRGAFFLRIDWGGCIIVTSGLPDPDQLFAHPYICMPDVPRSLPKDNLRAPLKATLNRIQALFSIRGARADEVLARHNPVPRQNHRRNNVTAAKLVGRSFGECQASPYDSLLDSIGAFFAVCALWLWFRLRAETRPATGSSDTLAEKG